MHYADPTMNTEHLDWSHFVFGSFCPSCFKESSAGAALRDTSCLANSFYDNLHDHCATLLTMDCTRIYWKILTIFKISLHQCTKIPRKLHNVISRFLITYCNLIPQKVTHVRLQFELTITFTATAKAVAIYSTLYSCYICRRIRERER